ncbi:MAG: hypothetical protein ACYCZR_02300, partial [Burkholderiales bacterium]
MKTINLTAGQISQIYEVGAGSRVTSTGNGTVQYYAGKLADAKNGVTWTDWPKSSSAGYVDTIRTLCIRATATGSMTVTIDEAPDLSPEGYVWEPDTAQYVRDPITNAVTGLGDPVIGEQIIVGAHGLIYSFSPSGDTSGATDYAKISPHLAANV